MCVETAAADVAIASESFMSSGVRSSNFKIHENKINSSSLKPFSQTYSLKGEGVRFAWTDPLEIWLER